MAIDAKMRRHSVKMVGAVKKQLTTMENILTEALHKVKVFQESIKECEFCGLPYIEERPGRSKYCSDICRANASQEAKKK